MKRKSLSVLCCLIGLSGFADVVNVYEETECGGATVRVAERMLATGRSYRTAKPPVWCEGLVGQRCGRADLVLQRIGCYHASRRGRRRYGKLPTSTCACRAVLPGRLSATVRSWICRSWCRSLFIGALRRPSGRPRSRDTLTSRGAGRR